MQTTANGSDLTPQPLEPLILTPEMIEQADDAYRRAAAEGLFSNRRWRLENFYWIKPEGGGAPKRFIPRDTQRVIYDHLIDTPEIPAVIIKSRRLGFSTGLSVFSSDQVAFEAGQNINLVDLTQPDAFKKMREQVRYSIDSLPRQILTRFDFIARNESHLALKLLKQPDSSISNLFAGMNARGGDASGLWVSEWGPLAAKDPHRSKKILSGAWPASRKGWRCVETTWMGGRNGDLWELIKPVLEGNPNADLYIYFFPWHGDPFVIKRTTRQPITKYPNLTQGDLECRSVIGEITPDVADYFRDLEHYLSKKFTDDQKRWWAIAKTTYRHEMAQEFPSTLEEALSAPGNSPKFSERGCNFIEKRQKDHKPQYGMLNMKNGHAVWEPSEERDPNAWLIVHEHPTPRQTYALPIDWCTGQKTVVDHPDYHAAGILRDSYMDETRTIHPRALVAHIRPRQRTQLHILVKQIAALHAWYGDCLVAPEINNLHGIIALMEAEGITNIYERQLYPDSAHDKRDTTELGWYTTVKTKPLVVEELATAIREESLIVYDPYILGELRAFQTNLMALEGCNDDWVMMLAIGNHVLPQATPMQDLPRYLPRAPTDHRPIDDHAYSDPYTQHQTPGYPSPGSHDTLW